MIYSIEGTIVCLITVLQWSAMFITTRKSCHRGVYCIRLTAQNDTWGCVRRCCIVWCSNLYGCASWYAVVYDGMGLCGVAWSGVCVVVSDGVVVSESVAESFRCMQTIINRRLYEFREVSYNRVYRFLVRGQPGQLIQQIRGRTIASNAIKGVLRLPCIYKPSIRNTSEFRLFLATQLSDHQHFRRPKCCWYAKVLKVRIFQRKLQ